MTRSILDRYSGNILDGAGSGSILDPCLSAADATGNVSDTAASWNRRSTMAAARLSSEELELGLRIDLPGAPAQVYLLETKPQAG